MQRKGRGLGPLETRFFSWTQSLGIRKVITGDVVRGLGYSPKQEAELLGNMAQSGFIVQLMRGLYLVPAKLPPGGRWTPSQHLILETLMEKLGAKYQVTGLTAFNSYGFETQVPNETCVYNTALSGRRTIAGLSFWFIKLPAERMGGEKTFPLANENEEGTVAILSSLPRSLLDAVYDYERFNTLPKAFLWIASKINDPKTLSDLVDYSIQYGNISTRRRLGYTLESLDVDSRLIKKILRKVPKTTSFIPLVPEKRPKGSVNRKWGLLINYKVDDGKTKRSYIAD